MSHKAQKQDMHGQHSKRQWFKDNFLVPMKDLVRKPGSRTPSPPPQGTLSEPSAAVNTNVPIVSSQEPPRMPTISPQSASAMVTPMEGAASPPNIHEGANIALTTDNQAEISNFPGSQAKDGFKTAWHGLKMILGQVEGLLNGTPFKMPVTAVNMLIQLGDAIGDNHESLKELMTGIQKQVEIIGEALVSNYTADTASTKMKEDFVRILVEDLFELSKLKNNGLWRDILENEQIKAEIQRILENVNKNSANFQLQIMLRTEKNTAGIFESLVQNQFKDWPHSRKAIYNADLEDETKFPRGPCTSNTRVSILEKIYQWAQDTTPESPHVFWLTGQAGSGKSTIAYTVAQHFDQEVMNLSCNLQATFFCSRQFTETKLQRFIIPTIVYQLAQNSRSFVYSLHNSNKFDSVDIPSKQMKDLLTIPWQKYMAECATNLPPYLIVIDALDEIEGRKGSAFLKELLTTINAGCLSGLKFLVTSRLDPKIVHLCKQFTSDAVCHLHHVPQENVQEDIQKYLNASLSKLQNGSELVNLARKADGLFIYASTAVKYISYPEGSSLMEQQRKLSKLLESNFTMNEQFSHVDEIYCQILYEAFIGFDNNDLNARLRILHTFLCAEERISPTLAAALVNSKDIDQANNVVEKLHAVLFVKDDCIFWYHASFPDFIFNQIQSKFTVKEQTLDMSCDAIAHHELLAIRCLEIMMKELKFNICGLESSFLFDEEVPELDKKRAKITRELKYACQYWAQHMTKAMTSDVKSRLQHFASIISKFLHEKFIFWIETMNLLQLVHNCKTSLQQVAQNINASKYKSKVSNIVKDLQDAASFTAYFSANKAALSTPHLYISALATWAGNGLLTEWKSNNVVRSVAFSPDGTQIVSGSDDSSVQVWDTMTGKQVQELQGHTHPVTSVAFSPDGAQIVSGSDDNSVRVWDAMTGKQVQELQSHTHSVTSVAFSPDGAQIVSGSDDNSVRVWDAITGKEVQELQGHTDPVTSVAFSPDGTVIVSGSDDNSVWVWDAMTGKQVQELQGHTHSVTSVAFSPDATGIVSGSRDNSVRVWDAMTGKQVQELQGHTHPVTSVAFSPDGAQIVSGSYDNSVQVWDAMTGKQGQKLQGHTDWVTSVAFSSDGAQIVSGSYDNSVRVWEALTGKQVQELQGHTAPVVSVAFSPDGAQIVSGSYDNSVGVWDAMTGKQVQELQSHTDWVISVAFSPDGAQIVSGSRDNSIRVWDAMTGKQVQELQGHTHSVSSVAFSPDGTEIVSGSRDNSVRVWDALTGKQMQELQGHTDPVISVAFSPDGDQIVSGSYDNSVRVWNAMAGKQVKELQALNLKASFFNNNLK
ncbi:hypothetical protein C0992_005190 [Termitomyces sp. T32_za158]|nr:hypothetical protein C0992_005190 [Termitomyces sp. T32_za158]